MRGAQLMKALQVGESAVVGVVGRVIGVERGGSGVKCGGVGLASRRESVAGLRRSGALEFGHVAISLRAEACCPAPIGMGQSPPARKLLFRLNAAPRPVPILVHSVRRSVVNRAEAVLAVGVTSRCKCGVCRARLCERPHSPASLWGYPCRL